MLNTQPVTVIPMKWIKWFSLGSSHNFPFIHIYVCKSVILTVTPQLSSSSRLVLVAGRNKSLRSSVLSWGPREGQPWWLFSPWVLLLSPRCGRSCGSGWHSTATSYKPKLSNLRTEKNSAGNLENRDLTLFCRAKSHTEWQFTTQNQTSRWLVPPCGVNLNSTAKASITEKTPE